MCVGSLGVCKGVALVRVSAFAMYRIGLAAPRALPGDDVWNNLELAIFTGRRRRATILLCLCRGIESLIKIML